ncbi:MAG TPA: helix-turn-helix domain-containing protein, partial [Gaiellaceae bacterium]|nr:helix-turn-helix domain-containing protein [Gaiellaceae bacterium]
MELDAHLIGSSLRARREQLGLTLQRAEAETRIRSRYLAALEEERFDDLPAEAYARGFLRSYATYLGLDGGAYLAAYRSRHRPEEPAIAPTPVAAREPSRRWATAAAAAVAVAAAVGLGAWKLDPRGEATPAPDADEQRAPEPEP